MLYEKYGIRIPVVVLPDGREKGWPFTSGSNTLECWASLGAAQYIYPAHWQNPYDRAGIVAAAHRQPARRYCAYCP